MLDIKQLLALDGQALTTLLRVRGDRSYVLGVLQFYVSENCNLLCNMCDIGQRNRLRIPLDRSALEYALIERTLRETADWFPRPRVHFIGGEPLMYKHLPQAAALLHGLGYWWGFTTNGWFLERDAEMLVETGCAALNVSVDGPEDAHNDIRGARRSFEKLVEGIGRLTRVKKQRGKSAPAIAVNCVINAENYTRLEEVVYSFALAGVQTVNFQHLIWDGRYNAELASRIDPGVLRKFMDQVDAGRMPLPVRFYPDVAREKLEAYYRELHSPELGRACSWPWFVVRVEPTGKVVLCMDTIGDLRQTTMREIWNGVEARQMRGQVIRTPAFHEMCVRCCHRQY